MYEKEDLAPEEIKSRAEQLGLTPSAEKEGIYTFNVEGKTESDIQNNNVEFERRGFKKVEKEHDNKKVIEYIYDASLAAPRG